MRRQIIVVSCALVLPTVARAQSCEASTGLTLQVLGSGGPRINRERASTSYLLWSGGRARVLIDAGGGAFLRFGQAGARLEDLSLVAISHLHPDHVSDLAALLWLSNLARQEPLPILGPTGGEVTPDFQTFLRRLFDEKAGAFQVLGGTLRGTGSGVPLDVTVVNAVGDPSVAFERSGMRVTAMGVPHGNIPTIAYRVVAEGATVVLSSDQTATDPRFIEFAKDADLLVMHLTIGVGERHQLHAAPDAVGRVARDARARRLVLGHIGQFDLSAAVAEVKKTYAGPVTVATDLRCTAVR
jgi:ribonuclease BN (tRNA processing enzyme)